MSQQVVQLEKMVWRIAPVSQKVVQVGEDGPAHRGRVAAGRAVGEDGLAQLGRVALGRAVGEDGL